MRPILVIGIQLCLFYEDVTLLLLQAHPLYHDLQQLIGLL